MGRPPHDRTSGTAIQPWPSSRRSRTRPPRRSRRHFPLGRRPQAAPATRRRARRACSAARWPACRSRRGPGPGGAARRRRRPRQATSPAPPAASTSRSPSAPGGAPARGGCRTAPPGTTGARATGIGAAQAAAADHRPGWRPADASLLIGRAGRPCWRAVAV